MIEHTQIGSFREAWSLHLPYSIGDAGSVRWTPDRTLQAALPIGHHGPRISEWAGIIEANHHPNLTLAARRLLRAVNERDAVDDALVDAVIALESLLGADGPELTFRVSFAVALLLGGDASGREVLRARTAHLYDIRSQVVHSGDVKKFKQYQSLDHAAADAVGLAAAVLANLYQGPASLRECKNKDRGQNIFLGRP